MPIAFMQPDPVGTPLGTQDAIAGGTVEQYNRDRQAYLQSLAMQQQAAEANARIQMQGAQMQQQRGLAYAQQQTQQNQLSAMTQPSAASAAGAANQQSLLAQQGQQQQALQAQQFTMADNLRLQRYQQGMSYLKDQLANKSIDQPTYQEAMASLNGVMGPLQMQQQQAKTAQMQAQTNALMHTKAQDTSSRIMDAQAIAKGIPQASGELEDGTRFVVSPKDGSVQFVPGTGKGHGTGSGSTGSAVGAPDAKQAGTDWHNTVKALTTKDANGIEQPPDPGAVVAHLQAADAWAKQQRDGAIYDSQGKLTPDAIVQLMAQRKSLVKMNGGSADFSTAPPNVQQTWGDLNLKLNGPQKIGIDGQPIAPGTRESEPGGPGAPGYYQPPTDPGQQNPPTGQQRTLGDGATPVPPGYREVAGAPGHIVRDWMREGTHYTVGKDENGEPKLLINKQAVGQTAFAKNLSDDRNQHMAAPGVAARWIRQQWDILHPQKFE